MRSVIGASSIRWRESGRAAIVAFVIRLRFVQEYRGRRIVTNGELYGIEGAFVTDCRYLDVDGARAAINSEAGVAAHREYWDSQRRATAGCLARHGAANTFACECGWQGGYNELRTEEVEGIVVLRCPTCTGVELCLVFPTGETSAPNSMNRRQRPSKPKPDARSPGVDGLALLTRISQLPVLAGDKLRFTWSFERDGADGYVVITAGEHIVWRERAPDADLMRFYAIRRLLKRKYTGQFVSMTPTSSAAATLFGQDRIAEPAAERRA